MASLDCGRGIHIPAAQDGGGADAPLRVRELLFARYPPAQTAAAFALALLVALACSFDPAAASYEAIRRIDPDATGALYIGYEVLLSFSGRSSAPFLFALVALAALLSSARIAGLIRQVRLTNRYQFSHANLTLRGRFNNKLPTQI